MQKITSTEQLKSISVRITNKLEFVCPITGRMDTYSPTTFSPAYRKRYAIKNHIISFIDEKSNWYVIPNLKGIKELLIDEGYIQAGFFVPGSDNKYPTKYKSTWDIMLEQAKKA